jgi:L-lactate dehydrogenase complex protein LldG
MSSREKILKAIKQNQPVGAAKSLPEIIRPESASDVLEKFCKALVTIGGTVLKINNWNDIIAYLAETFPPHVRMATTIPELQKITGFVDFSSDPHLLEDIKIAILAGHFGVAENGSVWLTDSVMGDRALPFITEHLALVISVKNIVSTLHDAYDRIELSRYEYGTFIAGPSKTADIEQSLVLGAHGPKSIIVFLMN